MSKKPEVKDMTEAKQRLDKIIKKEKLLHYPTVDVTSKNTNKNTTKH